MVVKEVDTIRRKISIAVALVMIFLFGITASTFAWFKINSNASVSGFEFTVQGGEGYQISIDGENYSNSINSSQMIKAILKGYRSNYIIKGDYIYNNPMYDSDGNLLDLGNAMSDESINYDLSSILLRPLSPVTNNNGSLSFRNYIKNEIVASSGQFVEFSIYFKALGNENDSQKYSIYVLGEDIINSTTGEQALKTSIKTKTTGDFAGKNVITLKASMTAISNLDTSVDFESRSAIKFGPDEKNNKTITVYTANAMRFSIGNENDSDYISESDYVCSNQIYEISDDIAYDLGSYATDYDDYITANHSAYSEGDEGYIAYSSLEHNLYDCDSNAQYTYYNSLKASDQIPMEYAKMPETIRHLTTVEEDKDKNSEYYDTMKYITTVESGKAAHKLTFRFWLEGYDADCFDDISQSVRVNLSFGSVKNNS